MQDYQLYWIYNPSFYYRFSVNTERLCNANLESFKCMEKRFQNLFDSIRTDGSKVKELTVTDNAIKNEKLNQYYELYK